MSIRICLILLALLEKKAFAKFINGKPEFFSEDIPSPLAYYYLDDGSGYDLKESVSGDFTAGHVIPENISQRDTEHTPNWVNDEFFGKTVACGDISNKRDPTAGAIEKDTLSLKDVDYGSSGAWAWSVWFRHEKGVNFPDYDKEQLFGHGDPLQQTIDINQVHVQMEKSGVIRTIVGDSNDAEVPTDYGIQDTDLVSLNNVDNGNWHQLILSTRQDGAKGFNVYVDGVLQASSPSGKGKSNPYESSPWLARGGEPIDPVGPIRFCGRAKPAEWNGGTEGEYEWDSDRYFRGQVAHFAVWDSSFTHEEASFLYFLYYNEYGLSAQTEYLDRDGFAQTEDNNKGGLGTGAMIGIVIGVVVGVALLIVVGLYVRKGRSNIESTPNVDSDLPSVN